MNGESMFVEVIGIDPGVVHTGVVSLMLDSHTNTLTHESAVVDGLNVDHPVLKKLAAAPRDTFIFIEGFRVRGAFNTNNEMMEAIGALKRLLPRATVIQNMGVRKVVPNETLKLLGLYKFDTVTHHQDLREAARTALHGIIKDEKLNSILYHIMKEKLQ